jgi:hypothetical protein
LTRCDIVDVAKPLDRVAGESATRAMQPGVSSDQPIVENAKRHGLATRALNRHRRPSIAEIGAGGAQNVGPIDFFGPASWHRAHVVVPSARYNAGIMTATPQKSCADARAAT